MTPASITSTASELRIETLTQFVAKYVQVEVVSRRGAKTAAVGWVSSARLASDGSGELTIGGSPFRWYPFASVHIKEVHVG